MTFKEKLQRGDLLVGTLVTLSSTEVTEILCQAGLDWLFVDLEHSALSIRDAQCILQTAAPAVPGVVRIPSHDSVWIKKALDIGAAGIIAPLVKKPEEARHIIRQSKYPPGGARSVGIARAQGYGHRFADYVASANHTTAVILQIEHIEAVRNIDAILAEPGIDGLFVGPYDLSASMDLTGRITAPEVQQAIARVKKAAQKNGIPLGIFASTAESAKPFAEEGYTLIAVGIDTMLLGEAAKSIADAFK